MKRLLFACAVCLMSVSTFAVGTFHAIIFADTNDGRLGKGFAANIDKMADELGIITAALDMESNFDLQVYEQFDCNSAKVKEVIKNFRCGPEDIVAFFYFGHGTRSAQDRSEFPQMILGERDQSKFIPLEDVLNALERKGARFTLVYGDCCNGVDSPGTTPKFGVLAAAGSSTISPSQKKAIRSLFLNNKGSFMISGCKKNEFSLYYNSNERSYFAGGILTISFIEIFESYCSRAANPNWDELMAGVRDKAFSLSSEIHKHRPDLNAQHPQWMNKLNRTTTPTTRPTTTTTPTPTPPNNVLAALVDIANEGKGISYRLNRRQTVLNTYFATNAQVDVVGRNGTTFLSEESATEFVERISTAFRLKNFVVHEKKVNGNGKITYLKLHEIYEDKK